MAYVQILLLENGNVIELYELKNDLTGGFVNDATVEVTLFDSVGDPVSGQAWPLTMDHVSEDPDEGLYRGTIAAAAELEDQASYTAIVDAEAPGSQPAHWEIPVKAVKRTGFND